VHNFDIIKTILLLERSNINKYQTLIKQELL